MVDPRNHITFKTPLLNLWSTRYHLDQSCKKSHGCDVGCAQNFIDDVLSLSWMFKNYNPWSSQT